MSNTVIITGGSKGIGWELVQTYARNGYKVISGARSIRKELPEDISENIKQILIDVKKREDHMNLVKIALKWTDNLDCYVNNAGFSEWRSIASVNEDFIKNMFETNLYGYFWGAQAAVSALKTGGSILNISSLAAKRGTPNNSVYSATKFGVTGLTQSLCKELGPRGIRVNAVCPVLVETPGLADALNQKDSPANGDSSLFLTNFSASQTALGRLPSATEVAQLCLFLTSKNASGITGQSINVDCGVLPN
jgi:3-oxoacyl-[acyl-carrier protein] reductase/meso-butanediol dehydrogenase/(S,S)-butanediol dehydrogenase/diacetyl reductase